MPPAAQSMASKRKQASQGSNVFGRATNSHRNKHVDVEQKVMEVQCVSRDYAQPCSQKAIEILLLPEPKPSFVPSRWRGLVLETDEEADVGTGAGCS